MSCTGPGPVNLHITTGGSSKQDIMSTTVLDIKTLRLPPTNASSLALSLRATSTRTRKVRIWMSSRRRNYPFPDMPQDKSIRVFESLNTCHSITIGWKTSADERVKRYHRFSNRRFSDLIMQKIKGLQPDTKYLLEVQVTKVKGEMLPYEQVWARTAKTCSKKVKTEKNKSVFLKAPWNTEQAFTEESDG
ncbi:protein NDNF [Caerostris extrusa]|uniref:Protein NDNF n=1 Tax=Caerostris extrusa TaxID=172846 RepID=A0AAV4XZA0_CAEEX|nr:protein NDNF [Caerostris extrusa]